MRHSPVLNMEHQNWKITKSCRALICSLATFVKIMASLSIRFKYQLYKTLMKSEHGRQDYHSFKEIWSHYVCFGQLPLVPRKTANPVLTVSANFWTPERNTAFIFAWTSPGLHSLYCRSLAQRIICSLFSCVPWHMDTDGSLWLVLLCRTFYQKILDFRGI